MPLAQIAVHVALSRELAKDSRLQQDSLRAALLSACSDSAIVVQCVGADSAPEAVAVALVTFRDDGEVRIEIGTKGAQGDQWTARNLHFAPKDALVERWRAVGYAVGSLASALVDSDQRNEAQQSASVEPKHADDATESSPSTEPPSGSAGAAAEPSPARSSAPRPAPKGSAPPPANVAGDEERPHAVTEDRERPELPRTWAEAGLVGGPGLHAGELRFGGFLRLSRSFGHPFATLSGSYSVEAKDSRGVLAEWFSATAGAGYVASPARSVVLEARAEIAFEHLAVSIDEPATDGVDHAAHWVAGLRAGADAALTVADPISLFLGAETTVRLATTDVVVGNTAVGTAPAVDYSAFAGLRYSWR